MIHAVTMPPQLDSAPLLSFRFLGTVAVDIGGTPLDASATHVRAVLLVLALQPNHRVSRQRLGALLWPDVPPGKRAERVRWLLSKLRSLGVSLKVTNEDVALACAVGSDYADLLSSSRGPRGRQVEWTDRVQRVFGDGAPSISPAFDGWLAERHDAIVDDLLARLVLLLGALRRQGDWASVGRVAGAVLRVSALHEEATLALAESLCATGDRVQALRVLNEYLRAVEDADGDLRIPAELLRRRLMSDDGATASPAFHPAFVGRAEQRRRFESALAAARAGRGGAMLFAGPAGIGKTRLLDETAAFATTVSRARVVRARCQPGDELRPLSVLSDVIPQLLELPGAAGCDPETLRRLTRFGELDEGDALDANTPLAELPGARRHELLNAVCDLLSATSEEQTVVLQIDDFQWSDTRLHWLWSPLLAAATTHRVLWCFAARSDSPMDAAALFRPELLPSVAQQWLPALDAAASRQLLDDLLTQHDATSVDREALLARGSGIPLVLLELVRHWSGGGDVTTVPPTLSSLMDGRIARLTPSARRALQAAALLGTFSTVERLDAVLQLSRSEFIEALAQLERAGILATNAAGVTHGHVLWADAAVRDMESSVARMLHQHIAQQFDTEGAATPSIALLWESARHWELGGRADRALAAMQRGADHLAANGMYEEAADVYDRAIARCANGREQLALMRHQIDVLRKSGMPQRLVHAVERHEQLATDLDPAYDRHNDLELMILGLGRARGLRLDQVAEHALACARDTRASARHRLYASSLCVSNTATMSPGPMLREAYDILMSLTPMSDDDHRRRTQAEIYYHTCAGDREHALELAREYVRWEEGRDVPHSRCASLRLLSWSALVAGEIEMSFQAARDAVSYAHERRLDSILFRAYDSLFIVVSDYYGPAVFQEWLERAQPTLLRIAQHIPAVGAIHAVNHGELQLMLGDGVAAQRAFDERPSHILSEDPMWQARHRAFPLAAQMLMERTPERDAAMRALAVELGACFDASAPLMGFPAAIYAEWLDRYEGPDAADDFVERFLRVCLREVVPPRRLMPFVERVRRRQAAAEAQLTLASRPDIRRVVHG